MNSLTYQFLPNWLLQPLLAGAINLPEAAEMWDAWLLTPPGETRSLPMHLHDAASRLHLWSQEASKTKH